MEVVSACAPQDVDTGAISLTTRQGATAWQMPISQGLSSAQAQKPFIKGIMTPASRKMQQMLQKHSKEPLRILQRSRLQCLQHSKMAATGTPAQQCDQGAVVGDFRLWGAFLLLSVSLIHRLSTPLFWGMWGREVPLQPWAHFWKAPSLAHPWRDLRSTCSSQGSMRVKTEIQGQMQLTNLTGAMEAGNCIRGKRDFLNGHYVCSWLLGFLGCENIHPGSAGGGEGTPHSRSLVFLLPSSLSFPSPGSQLVNGRLPGMLKWSLHL